MKKNNFSGLLVAGIFFLAVGFIAQSVVLCLIGGICIFAFIKQMVNVKRNDNNSDIMSGVNRTGNVQYSNNHYAGGGSKTHQVAEIRYKTDKYDECKADGCNPNACPICGKISSNGFCADCGYRFRH